MAEDVLRDDKEKAGRVRVVRSRWGETILLCGKCLKRRNDGKALRQELKAAAKDYVATRSPRGKVKIVKIACVDLCPRRAIVLASAATLSAGEVVLLRDVADIAEVLPRLLPALAGNRR